MISLLAAIFIQAAHAYTCNDLIPQPSDEVEDSTTKNKIVVDYEYDRLNNGWSDWRSGYISYGHKFGFGSVIGRYSRANKFDSTGEQFEVDAYPHIRDGTYAYLNYGHSNTGLFPHDHYGAEVFQSLPAAYEISFGFRRLEFSGPVVLYTGVFGKYIGSYYLWARTYYTPSDIGASNSWTLGARYYLSDQEYFQVSAGWGLSIDQDPHLHPVSLRSQKAAADVYIALDNDWYVDPGIGYASEEIRAGSYREKWAFDVSVEKRF